MTRIRVASVKRLGVVIMAVSDVAAKDNWPRVTLVVGMAGSGKSTVTSCLKACCEARGVQTYTINLDPAVKHMHYEPNIDIRDTIDYEAVRTQYGLGPNGAILTACNLFATRFDQVVSICERRKDSTRHIIVDTPGQIEIFTWSASGTIICELLAASFETTVLFIVDTPRAQNPQIFMSNMLQCLSIVYKTKLPVFVAFNKTDIVSCDFARAWMEDEEALLSALDNKSTYSADLAASLISSISEFYSRVKSVGVSGVTSTGFDVLLDAWRF